ncbi:hypothetical protein Tco_1149250, partial [Tanacetum coccineum]
DVSIVADDDAIAFVIHGLEWVESTRIMAGIAIPRQQTRAFRFLLPASEVCTFDGSRSEQYQLEISHIGSLIHSFFVFSETTLKKQKKVAAGSYCFRAEFVVAADGSRDYNTVVAVVAPSPKKSTTRQLD